MGLLELVASNIVLQIVRLVSDFVLVGIFNFIQRRLQRPKNGVPEDHNVGAVAAGWCWCRLRSRAFLCQDVCGKDVRGAGSYGRWVMFVRTTQFLDCVRQAQGGEAVVANGLR
ncbi:unnamed protein product [Notodromas monacha]|uniref:Uncharacterized protein n=1 Tax=Notodromas monacha TaxID=399045 RepID=A0A7R9C2N5_9CRUS|nr:unnamed protein product [Notodromas monacha]CAG0924648.1 unnamed protein product [Notodromas monacha]